MRRQLTAPSASSIPARLRKRSEPSGARPSRLLGVALVTTALLLALASTAVATRTYQSQITGFTTPFGVEVDNGDNLWVTDVGASAHSVTKYDSSGSQTASNDGSTAWTTSTFINDLAFGKTGGLMYVLDSNLDDIWGLHASDATDAGVDLFGGDWDTGAHGGCCLLGGSVDNSGGTHDGDIYISSQFTQNVLSRVHSDGTADDFPTPPPGATYVSGNQITGTPDHPFSAPADVAVDASGDFYVADGGNHEVDRYHQDGTFVHAYVVTSGLLTGVAVDPTNGNVVTGDATNHVITEFDSAGNLLGTIDGLSTPAGSFAPQGLAFDSTGKLYVADPSNGVVDVFSPSISTNNLTVNCGGTGSGSVTPVACGGTQAETTGSTVHLTATAAAGSTFTGWSGGGCSGTGACDVTVNADTTVTATFAQNPPAVTTGAANGISQTGATVSGSVNPNGTAVTNCHVEFGTSTAYGSQVACSSLAGSGSSPVTVHATLSGLAAGTTYHFRVVATNSGGTSHGADATFRTSPKPSPTCATDPSLCPKSSKLKLSRATASVSGGKAAVKLFCDGAATCAGKVKLTAKIKVRKGHKTKTKTVVIGSASISIAPGGRVTVKIRLNRAALRVLAGKHRLKARITGPDGLKHAIVLKEKAKKKQKK